MIRRGTNTRSRTRSSPRYLKEGVVIADIGAGSGYFTFRLARHLGDTGRVYAVDISPDMILHLNRRIRDL